MKVLIDADLVLVGYLNRGDWEKYVELLWDMIESGHIKAHITEFGLEQLICIVSKIANTETAEEVSIDIQDIFQILPIENILYQQARELNLLNYHSALEIATAITNNLDAVVTLNPANFTNSDIKVLSIMDLCRNHLESSFCVSESDLKIRDNRDFNNSDDSFPRQITCLSQWLENIFDSTWQSTDKVFVNIPAYRYHDPSLKRCKLIDLQIEIEKITVALVITIKPENDHKIGVLIQIRPIDSSKYLPSNMKMIILDDEFNNIMEIISREKDDCIQCKFTGEYEDKFSIEILLKNSKFIENFIF